MNAVAARRIGSALGVLLASLGLLAWVARLEIFGRGATEVRPEPARVEEALALRVALLEDRRALVREDALYLVLDPVGAGLTLYRGGVPLRTYPVLAVEAGSRRFFAGEGKGADAWRERAWRDGRLVPEARRQRRVVVSDSVAEEPDPAGSVDWIPPTPEEEVPALDRFTLHYGAELGVEVVAERTEPRNLGDRWRAIRSGVVETLVPANWERHRVRITLPVAEAGALYRALPPSEVGFVVQPAAQ